MDSEERIIGALLEFKKSAEKRFDGLERQIVALQEERWKQKGAADIRASIVAFLTVLAAGVVKYVAEKIWG